MARFEQAGRLAQQKALALALDDSCSLATADELEVNFVDDEVIADLHLRFMDIPGATDVITFEHGEIHISVETAARQAEQYGNGFERELMLYIIHGLLHLAGYEDAIEVEQLRMNRLQEGILAEVWSD